MGMARPTGDYVERMLASGGWPEVDEEAFYERAGQYTQVLRQVTDVLEAAQHQQIEVFDGGVWAGGAAGAAHAELATNIGELIKLQNGLATVITWQKYVAGTIVQAKADIGDNLENAYRQISVLQADTRLDADERTAAIDTLVTATNEANVSLVTGTAERIRASTAWQPPGHALQELLDQKTPPPVEIPDVPTPVPAPPEEQPGPAPAPPGPVTPVSPISPQPAMPAPAPGTPVPGTPVPGTPAPGAPSPIPATPASPAGPPTSPAPTPSGPGPAGPNFPGAAPAAPLQPAASVPPLGGGKPTKGIAPAAASPAPAQPAGSGRAEDAAPAVAPAAATGMPAAPMAPGGAGGAGGGGGGAAPGSRSGSNAPAGQKPSGATSSTRPAAAGRPAARTSAAAVSRSVGSAKPNERKDTAETPAVTPIPVSAARAERDAIAEASTAEAARRKSGGPDPLRLARRIAAALNAPGGGGQGDFGFFWVTAVTTGGAIVVANSYGLAYIPEGVRLPEPVILASADETIPAAGRARWATYPMMAVQGWAEHHDTTLRAVIATEEQFANSDPGAAKVVLTPEDIPASGRMAGRSRLEVVVPDAAESLAATHDARLTDLLPPAPAGAGPPAEPSAEPEEAMDAEEAALLAASVAAGTISLDDLLAKMPAASAPAGAPADQRPMLWFEVIKPMSSSAIGRQAAHLRAFHTYAAHAQDVVLRQAHTAVDVGAQRAAAADWLYWKHLAGVLDAALTDASWSTAPGALA